MRKAGILVAALAACLTLAAPTSRAWATMVSLTFDDGLAGVYNNAFPVLKKYGVPGVSGIITSKIDVGNDDYMTWEQIRELAAAGWEIASHSVHHARPIHIPKFYSQEQIYAWCVDCTEPPLYQTHYDYELITGLSLNGRPLREVETFDELRKTPGSYFFDKIIEELHVHPFQAGDPANLDIRAFSYEREMEESKKELARHGFDAVTFVAPYNYWTDDVKEVSRQYYRYAVTGKGEDNRPSSFDPYAIKRFMVHKNDSVSSLQRIVKENAVDKGSWVIFCLHGIGDNTGWEPWGADKLDRFIAWLKQENIEVVTIAEGARRMAASAPAQPSPVKKSSVKPAGSAG